MYPLSGGCGYCLSNRIDCSLLDSESQCLTCRDYGIQCPPGPESCDSSSPVIKEDQDSPMEDVLHTPQDVLPLDIPDITDETKVAPVHWMNPLDSYKTIAHELLGLPIPGLPDHPLQPAYAAHLPPFIQSPPLSLPEEDIQYLAQKGAFTIPDGELRNELLKAFILHVHPYLPVLDLPVFLEAIASNDGQSRISLLLFHAVMFSSAAFIDPQHIERAGYSSRKAARQEFFRKARLLYDFDVEHDRIVLIQSVLLMTYWHETPDDPKDFRYWLEIALSLAASVAFHNSSEWASETASHGLWKRIWWCMYTRDRLVALNLRRPAIIRDEEFSVPAPTIADFDIHTYPVSVTNLLGNCQVLHRRDQQRQLAQMFIEKAKLCTIISRIDFFPPVASTTVGVVTSPNVLEGVLKSLEDWYARLSPEMQYRAPPSPDLPAGERSLFAYRAWLKMLYLAASGALYRQQESLVENHPGSSPASSCASGPGSGSGLESAMTTRTESKMSIQTATQAIAVVAEGLHQLDLVHCLPTTTVGLLMPVLATHIMNIRSDSPDLWGVGFQSFYQCMKVLEKLGEVYVLAESVRTFFESVVCGDKETHINNPAKDMSNSGMPPAFLEGVLTSSELKSFVHLVGQKGVVK